MKGYSDKRNELQMFLACWLFDNMITSF